MAGSKKGKEKSGTKSHIERIFDDFSEYIMNKYFSDDISDKTEKLGGMTTKAVRLSLTRSCAGPVALRKEVNEKKGKSIAVNEQKGKPIVVHEQKGKPIVINEQKGKPIAVNEQKGKPIAVNEQKGKSIAVSEQKGKSIADIIPKKRSSATFKATAFGAKASTSGAKASTSGANAIASGAKAAAVGAKVTASGVKATAPRIVGNNTRRIPPFPKSARKLVSLSELYDRDSESTESDKEDESDESWSGTEEDYEDSDSEGSLEETLDDVWKKVTSASANKRAKHQVGPSK